MSEQDDKAAQQARLDAARRINDAIDAARAAGASGEEVMEAAREAQGGQNN